MHVAIVGGGGAVGSSVAYSLALASPEIDLTIIDADADAGYGHALDIHHANRHVSHPVGRPSYGPEPVGAVESAEPGPEAVADADCVVVTASAPRKAGGSERGGRLTYLERNLEIASDVGGWLRQVDPRPLVCVSNPMDRIAYRLWTASGWPRRSILGYSLSETARLADWFARRENVDPSAVSCPVLGEHGEYIVPAFSRATIEGRPVDLSPDEREDALDFVRDAPYEIIQHRGPDDSSRWVTGRGVALLVERLLADDMEEPICLSVPLEGEYGFEGVCLSVPVELGSDGWTRILDWELSDWERARLEDAYEAVRGSLSS